MNESRKRFVDQLLAADPPSPDARDRYEKEVRAMLEQTLGPRRRLLYFAAAVLLAQLAALFGWVSTVLPRGQEAMPFFAAIFIATSLALLGVAGHLLWAAWRGVVHRPAARVWAAGLGVAYIGLLGWLFLLMSGYIPERLRNDVWVLGLVLLVYAAVAWMRHRVAQAEMRTAEKLLEIELRLAEIGEALQQGRAGAPGPP